MEARASHITAALAAASAGSRAAFGQLCAHDDEESVQGVMRVVGAMPSYLEEVRQHPSARIRAVGWAHEIASARGRRRRGECVRAGGSLDASAVCALGELLAEMEGVGGEVFEWVVGAMLARREHDPLALLSLRDDHNLSWELRCQITEALADVASSGAEAEVCDLVLSQSRWVNLNLALMGASRDPGAWVKHMLSEDEEVVVVRRICVDGVTAALVEGREVGGEQWECSGFELEAAELRSMVESGEGGLSNVWEEAVRQSVCARLGSAPPEALAAVLDRCGVGRSEWEILGSVNQLLSMQMLRTGAWDPGLPDPSQAQELYDVEDVVSPGAGALEAAVRQAVSAGQGGEAVAALLAQVQAAAQDPRVEDVRSELQGAVAALLVDEGLAWELVGVLVSVAEPNSLDSSIAELPASEAGDQRFVELASNVPYVCDSEDLRARAATARCARAVLARLCDPGFIPAGAGSGEGTWAHWRANAIMACCEVISLSRAEAGMLPWKQVHGERAAAAVGSYLAHQLGENERSWEVLAGLAESFEGSVAELALAAIACSR